MTFDHLVAGDVVLVAHGYGHGTHYSLVQRVTATDVVVRCDTHYRKSDGLLAGCPEDSQSWLVEITPELQADAEAYRASRKPLAEEYVHES